jgi:hypothetical protein
MSPFGAFPVDEFLEQQKRLKEDDDRIRITYEDPGQREERRRLMGLGNLELSTPASGSATRRRSSRIAGF